MFDSAKPIALLFLSHMFMQCRGKTFHQEANSACVWKPLFNDRNKGRRGTYAGWLFRYPFGWAFRPCPR